MSMAQYKRRNAWQLKHVWEIKTLIECIKLVYCFKYITVFSASFLPTCRRNMSDTSECVLPKLWYPPTRLHDVITHYSAIPNLTAPETSRLIHKQPEGTSTRVIRYGLLLHCWVACHAALQCSHLEAILLGCWELSTAIGFITCDVRETL